MWSYTKIVIWANAWLIFWATVFVFTRNKRDNCLSWAMKKHDTEGGYLVIRWCRSNRFKFLAWPHFLWLDEKHGDKLLHYLPKDQDNTEKAFPHPWFEGKVKRGDDEKDQDN